MIRAGLSGPARHIRVEPITQPQRKDAPAPPSEPRPAPAPEKVPEREKEKTPA